MQLSPINSLSTSKDIKKTQNTSSFVPATSTHSLPIVLARNTNETPLSQSSNQAIAIGECLTHSATQVSTLLNAQSQYEYNSKNFWQEFCGDVTEDVLKDKILDYIKNNWGVDSSLKQNINNPMLETRKDIQYQLLVDMLFQLKFTYFINLIITDIFNFIQTENKIKRSNHLDELALIIAKYDVKDEISTKLSFIFNTLCKNYFNSKNEILPQETLIKMIPLLTTELQLAEKENLETKVDSDLYAIILPKIESLFTEGLNLSNKDPNENDEINSIVQNDMHTHSFTDDMPDIYSHSFTDDMLDMDIHSSITQDTDTLDMHAHSSITHLSGTTPLEKDITFKEPKFTQPTMSNELESITDINESQKSNMKAKKKSDKWMLRSFLVNIFEEHLENYEQAVFQVYKENNPLKEKYLNLTISALQTKKASQQIKTRIAQLGYPNSQDKYIARNMSKLRNLFYKDLANMLINFVNYHKLMKELQPQKFQTKISINEIKKINKELVEEIQKIRNKLVNSKKRFNNILNRKQITKRQVRRQACWYLTEQKALDIFKKKFINLSIDQIKEIILSTKLFQIIQDNTTPDSTPKIIQESNKSEETLKLKFLLANIFTVPFYYDEQLLFKVYQEGHPLKNKYLLLITSALEATKACLKTKSRIAQLIHSKHIENYDPRIKRMAETYLCKDLTELFERASSYYSFMEELKPVSLQIINKISARKMKRTNKALVDQVRALQNKTSCTQRYYNEVLKEKKITENQVIKNIFIYLIEKKVLETIQKRFTNLSDNQIKEIIISTKTNPQIKDARSNENITNLSQKGCESEEIAMLESVIINIFKNPFYYNEQDLFDAYMNNIDSKEDLLALAMSAMQAKRACFKIKTRIVQLANLAKKDYFRASEVSTEKNFLYRDLTELFISSSHYNQLMDKLQLPSVQTQKSSPEKPNLHVARTQMRVMASIDEDLATLIRQKKNQLRITQRYFHSTVKDRQITENQIVQNTLLYLTEPKAIKTFKEKFTSLTEDKIKETITRSVLHITENQANKAAVTGSSKQLSLEQQNDNLSTNLAPVAKKRCIQKSQASANLSKASPESTASQSSSQASILRFSSSQSVDQTAVDQTARESSSDGSSSDESSIHSPSQGMILTPTPEETKIAKASQINTKSADISFPDLFFELFGQEGLSEDSAIQKVDTQENE